MMKIKARLYCPNVSLTDDINFSPDDKQAHYLLHVMRIKIDDYCGVFNGIDGEYACQIIALTKKNMILKPIKHTRPHLLPTKMCLIFAIIKKTPLEFLVQKATELGVGILQPIITERTVIREVNQERLQSIAIEAAEQCCLTAIPQILPVKHLSEVLLEYQNIVFCDERGQGESIKKLIPSQFNQDNKIDAILIGPEGGFSDKEADFLYTQKNLIPVSLGERIMRSETAALASLAILI
jgi:16S rRNA (uracil1498-N3)-methyltransferase